MSNFETSFGMHCPCDKETYKKYKKVRNFIELTRGKNNRFKWFWRKAPQNRVNKRTGIAIQEPALFNLFFVKKERDWGNWNYSYEVGPKPDTDQYKYQVTETDLYRDFMMDYENARHPKKTQEEVMPLLLSLEMLDHIIEQYEKYLTPSKICV